jgi:acetyl esterase/lipase
MLHEFGPMGKPPFRVPDADVSHIRRKWLDLVYAGTSPAQMLDLYLPDQGEGPFPVVVHIHGGGFEMGSKRSLHVVPVLRSRERGYAVAAVDYRLSGEAIFPAGLQDVKAAIRWLRANAEAYHLDADRVAVWGGSSGGNYAAMICATANVADLEGLSLGNAGHSCAVQAAVDWFGPTDFGAMDAQLAESGLGRADHSEAHSPESRYLGARITDVPDLARRANPMTYIHADMPPILIQHGRLDALVPVQQSICFAQKLEQIVGPDRFELDILEGAGHGDPQFESDENMGRVLGFLDRHLQVHWGD